MIIDFHTHTFPDAIADRAVGRLAQSGGIPNYLDGRIPSLLASMKKAHIDYSVLLPVATKPTQYRTINDNAYMINETTHKTGLISFGAIHPDNENYREIIKELSNHHIKGIKLHPVFQKVHIDDTRYLKIINCAFEYDMIVTIHCGLDISFPGCDESSVERVLHMIKQVPPHKLVLAHMGGWAMWNQVKPLFGLHNIWLDTAFVMKKGNDAPFLTQEKFYQMAKAHGTDKILFGTDSPWSDQAESMGLIRSAGFTPEEERNILGGNAALLLGC